MGDFKGERLGQTSKLPGVNERLNGLSVASIRDLRWTGDLGTKNATGRLGNGLSTGDSRGFLTGSGRWLSLRTGLDSTSED